MKKNRLDINYWLRKIFVTKIFQKLIKNKSSLRKTVFTSIYKSKHWAQHGDLPDEYISVSGHGSNINTEQSNNLISSLVEFINKNNINSILDMPCGDFLWMNKLLKQVEVRNYLGLDIVGLMCIPPLNNDSENYFKDMSELNYSNNFSDLSMGMSSDYIKACIYNSTFLRLGSVIFGPRS